MRRAILGLSTLLGFLVLTIYSLKVAAKHDYTDFLVYYRAAERAKNLDWAHVYNHADGASPFRYAPVTLLLFRPFAALPLATAQLLWFYLQFAWFALGFVFIHRALRAAKVSSEAALVSTFLSSLLVLRFCLDCFTIGQVSSLLFLGYAYAYYGWCAGRSGAQGAGMFLPALFKIGPGFQYLLFPFGEGPRRQRAFRVPLGALVVAAAGTLLWVRSWTTFRGLFSGWAEMVSSDSSYYDASHYGSQSLKSSLLRLVKSGWLSMDAVTPLLLASALGVCVAIVVFWAFRKPKRPENAPLFFALGIFPYLWFMPETFKYTLTALAIPFSGLLAGLAGRRRDPLTILALMVSAATLSAAGLDIVGEKLFFALQTASVPFLATVLTGVATFALAWRESEPSSLYLEIRGHFPGRKIGPWPDLPEREPAVSVSALIPVPVHPLIELDGEVLRRTIGELRALLERRFPDSHEILVIPYGDEAASRGESAPPDSALADILGALEGSLCVHMIRPSMPGISLSSRALALREGFLFCSGRSVLSVHAEQPCSVEFYEKAIDFLNAGYALVRANRRLPESRFRIPVRLLPLVYGRHRLGLIFNRLVRAILPVETTDTQSGSWAMGRSLALEVFALQSSPDFLFDLELTLTATAQKARQVDLPVLVELPEEKAPHRVVGESLAILLGLPVLAHRYERGCYSALPEITSSSVGITADDWGLSEGVNEGILELARSGVVRRVSLMANEPALEHGLEELRSISGIELGIHFNLTHGKPLTPYRTASPFGTLRRWLSPGRGRARERDATRAELDAQLDRLEKAGVKVRYFDGHHHVHLAPGMIDAVADVLKRRGIQTVRLPYDPALLLTPRFPLVLLSVLARSRIRANGFSYRPCFYPQAGHFLDHGEMRSQIARRPGFEVIVHPARVADVHSLPDPDHYSEGRVTEYQALRMLGFEEAAE